MKYVDQRLFIILVRYKQPMSEIERHLAGHREFVEKWYQDGFLIASGRGADHDPGAFVGYGQSREAIAERVKEDPLLKYGVADYEIIQFHASRVCDALASVFQSGARVVPSPRMSAE
jgi:uncharacterized protein YciI